MLCCFNASCYSLKQIFVKNKMKQIIILIIIKNRTKTFLYKRDFATGEI